MNVVEESKRLYMPFLDDEYRARVEALDVPDQVYFWTYLYYELPREINRTIIKEMEKDVIDGRALMRPVIKASVRRAKTLDDLWDSTRPHSWFKNIVN